MKIGSTVKAVVDFAEVKSTYPRVQYPDKGQELTVSDIQSHPNKACRRKGIVLLFFKELPWNIHGICDRQIDGKPNFIEFKTLSAVQVGNRLEYSDKPGLGGMSFKIKLDKDWFRPITDLSLQRFLLQLQDAYEKGTPTNRS